jgi:hypothetical protein
MDLFSDDFSTTILKGSIKSDLGEFSLDSQMLRVLMELNGQKDLASVARSLEMKMGTLKEVILKLDKLKLIEKKATPMLDNNFLDFLKNQLNMAVGPIAEYLIEDEIQELGGESNTIPIHRAAELVDLLAKQILRKEKRVAFQQAMIKKIKEIH